MIAKKYYWLKLKESFFEEDTISWLEEQENGVYYTNFYLKLCLKSLKTNGILIRNVGEILIPYDIKKLAEITHVKLDTAIVAMELFKKIGLVQILENGEIYLTQLELMVGKETSKAELMRNKRQREKLNSNKKKVKENKEVSSKSTEGISTDYACCGSEEKLSSDHDFIDEKSHVKSDVISDECGENIYGNNVTQVLPECYTEKDIDKELEIETEKEKHKELDTEKQTDKNTECEKDRKPDGECEKKTGKAKKSDRKTKSKKVCGGVSLSKSKLQLEGKSVALSQGDGCNYDSSNNKNESSEELSGGSHMEEELKKESTCDGNSENRNGTEYLSNIKVFKHFEKCGFTVTTQLMEYISEDINTYSEEWVIEAANECVTRNKADNYSYLTGILQKWKSRGRIERSLNRESKANASAYEPMKSILD